MFDMDVQRTNPVNRMKLCMSADIISRGSENCRKMFSQAYDGCYEKVSWAAAWLLCWPMKLTFVCNIVQGEQQWRLPLPHL